MIGVIADDVTGATDVAAALRRAGLRTLLALGTDIDDTAVSARRHRHRPEDALTFPPQRPSRRALAALAVLRQRGADRIYVQVLLDLRLHRRGEQSGRSPRRSPASSVSTWS